MDCHLIDTQRAFKGATIYSVSFLICIVSGSGQLRFPTTPHLPLSDEGGTNDRTHRLTTVRLSDV